MTKYKNNLFNSGILILFMLVVSSSTGFSQTYNLSGFKETKIPKYLSPEWTSISRSSNIFGVSVKIGQLIITKKIADSLSRLKTSSGTFTAYDKTYRGGYLSFDPRNKRYEHGIKVAYGNIKFVFMFNDKLCFIQGHDYTLDSGTMYQLEQFDDKFICHKIMDLEDGPMAYTIFQNKLFIAGSKSLSVIEEGEKKVLLKDALWNQMEINSIAVFDEKTVYLGANGGIFKLDLETKKLKFYLRS